MIKNYIKKLIKEVLQELEKTETLDHTIKQLKSKHHFNDKDIFWKQFFKERLSNIRVEVNYYDHNDYMENITIPFKNIKELYNFVKNPIVNTDMRYIQEAKLWINFDYKNQKRLELYAPYITNSKQLDMDALYIFYDTIKNKIENHPEILL